MWFGPAFDMLHCFGRVLKPRRFSLSPKNKPDGVVLSCGVVPVWRVRCAPACSARVHRGAICSWLFFSLYKVGFRFLLLLNEIGCVSYYFAQRAALSTFVSCESTHAYVERHTPALAKEGVVRPMGRVDKNGRGGCCTGVCPQPVSLLRGWEWFVRNTPFLYRV